MKRNQIIIIAALLGSFALVFIYIIAKKKGIDQPMKEEQTTVYLPVRKVMNMQKELQIISYGQVTSNAEIDVAFEVQGRLERGFTYLKPGVRFSEGQQLYKVNSEEVAFTLSSRKTQLANLVVGVLPDIELDYPSEKSKWLKFLDGIQHGKSLPTLPEINVPKERMFLTSRGVLSEYYSIKSAEARLQKYVYYAPFSGSVIETYAEPGAIANPGTRIARIAKTNEFEVKVPISTNNLKSYQKQGKVTFYTVDGEQIGIGSIARISDVINQQTQSVDVYFSIKPLNEKKLYSGMYLNVAINQKSISESITVPRIAVTEGKISVLKNGGIVDRTISIVGTKPDSLYISGLSNGEMVVLEKVEIDRKGKLFKGIER